MLWAGCCPSAQTALLPPDLQAHVLLLLLPLLPTVLVLTVLLTAVASPAALKAPAEEVQTARRAGGR